MSYTENERHADDLVRLLAVLFVLVTKGCFGKRRRLLRHKRTRKTRAKDAFAATEPMNAFANSGVSRKTCRAQTRLKRGHFFGIFQWQTIEIFDRGFGEHILTGFYRV